LKKGIPERWGRQRGAGRIPPTKEQEDGEWKKKITFRRRTPKVRAKLVGQAKAQTAHTLLFYFLYTVPYMVLMKLVQCGRHERYRTFCNSDGGG